MPLGYSLEWLRAGAPYRVTSEGMKRGYWKVVNRAGDAIQTNGSKAVATAVAKQMNEAADSAPSPK